MDDPVERVRAALRSVDLADSIRAFPEGTRTSVDAAAAIGCSVAQIAKSIVFRTNDRAVIAIASGANRVAKAKLIALTGVRLESASPDFVLTATGFVAGGVSPVGHTRPVTIFIDRDLMALPRIWAAAGSPTHVFPIAPDVLVRLTGGSVADIRQDP
jgi:prolyl-tRNA editing enzyme YbaK/EbsC (Cys-tRNA(Pro) deacylase)